MERDGDLKEGRKRGCGEGWSGGASAPPVAAAAADPVVWNNNAAAAFVTHTRPRGRGGKGRKGILELLTN